MVKIGLQINCQFESLEFLKTCENYNYFLKLRCNNCGESDNVWHSICEEEKTQQDSRNPKGFNMIIKCKMCSRENTIDIVEGSTMAYTEDNVGQWRTIVHFECRGLEPTDFDPREGFVVKAAEEGETFEDVAIEGGDWSDFDEKNGNAVSISEFKSQFIKIKGK